MSRNTNPCAAPRSNVATIKPESSCLALAERSSRFWAHLLDVLITGIPTFAMIWMVFASLGVRLLGPHRGAERLIVSIGTLVFGGGLYFAINGYLLAHCGQSVGKRICNICIVRHDGSVPDLWDSFVKRHLSILIVRLIPFVGYLFYLVEVLFIFRENRLCLHDEIAGTLVVKGKRARQSTSMISPTSAPSREMPKESAFTAALPGNLEICPYCAELTSGDTNACRGCGRNPFSVNSQTANRSLNAEELLQKAARLYGYGHGHRQEALDVHFFATMRFPLSRQAWMGLLNAPNTEPAIQQEARLQLEKIERVLRGEFVV